MLPMVIAGLFLSSAAFGFSLWVLIMVLRLVRAVDAGTGAVRAELPEIGKQNFYEVVARSEEQEAALERMLEARNG